MATILERFKETSHETFNHQSDTIDVNGSSSANLPIIKDETSKRSLCPYTSKEKQGDAQSSVNGLEGEKSKDSPSRSLSPEFLLGSSEKSEQTGPAVVVKPVTCVFCNEIVPSHTALEEHTKSKHSSSDKKWYDCSVCEKHFAHRSSRDIHLRVHTGQRPYECDYCKKRFRVSSHLRDHIRTHTGERPFKCEVCGRGFKQSSDMKKHRKTHFKEMPAVPQTSTEASYMIVRPEDNTTSADHSPNELRSPTERQNIKLVIKRERKSTDIRSPMDNNTKTVASNNALPSGDCAYSASSLSGNKTIPGEKPSEVGTQKMEANEKALAASNLDSNANWAPSWYYSYDNSVPTIKSTEKLPKNSPGKVAVKRKLGRGSKSYERNGYKANSYPSMASGIGQIYTSNCGVNLSQQDSSMPSHNNDRNKMQEPTSMASGIGQIYTSNCGVNLSQQDSSIMPSHNNDRNKMQEPTSANQQNTALSYNADNQTGNSKDEHAAFEKRLSYDNMTAKQMSNQNEAHVRNDDAFWQPQNKVIKTEKLSPNSHEQSTHCRELSTPHHELPTVSHKQPTGIYDQLTNIHDRRSKIHEQTAYNHEHPPYYREQSTDIHEQATNTRDPTVYAHDWQTESSEDHIMNFVNNGEVASTTNEDLTNNGVNSTRDTTSAGSIAKQRTDDSTRTETQALENISTEIPEDVAAIQRESKVAPGNVTSKPEVPVRKAVVVKMIRTPIKLKDTEEDVQCSVCDQSFKNMDEFTAHKCGKNGKSFTCTICNKIFARQTLLRQHMVLHQGSKRFRFKCNYCGRAFRHRSHLRDHERIHTGERPFKCSFCPKAFKQSSDHRKHENLHTGTTRYRCEKCSLDFKRCDALKRHAMMHTKGEVTLLKCEKCRSLFATVDGHMSHVCLNKPYRYRCQICPERFTDADDLRRHCYDLHGEQSTLSCLKCEFCKLEFNSLEKLDDHLGTHRLKKTHRCRTCDQRFSLLNQLVEHVKIHSTPSLGTSAPDQSKESRIEETRTIKKDFNQHMESPPNVKIITHTSNRPVRQNYDFIPSKYQPLIHTNPMYGEMTVGNWAGPHNYYLPLRPKDHGVPRKEVEPAPISPRHQPISPRNRPISPRHNPISPRTFTEGSANNTISSPSNVESYRRSTEPPVNPAVSFHSTTEPHRRSVELSENHSISSRSNTEHHRPMSSENGTNESRPPTTANTGNEYPKTSPTAFADPYSTTSFATYRAIAMSRSTHRTIDGQRRDQKASQNQSPPNQYERITSRHDPTYSMHESTNRKQETQTSVANVEVSHGPDVATGAGEVYPVNNPSDSPMVSPSQVRNYSDSLEIHRNANESRSYSDDVRSQTEVTQRSSDETRTNLEETQRNSDEVQIASERIRKNSESMGRENLTTSENGTANGRRNTRPRRKNGESQSVVKRKYTCLNCRSEFYNESSLVDHVCDIFSETIYRCLVCKEDFENYDDLQQHMRTHWKQVTNIKCTLCGERLRSEELLKKHNLKHLEGGRAERSESVAFEEDKHAYHRIANDKTQDDHPETLITPPGSAKSVTSPVICSVSGNIVTKPKTSERGYNERRSSNMDDEIIPTELTNQNAVRDVIPRSNSGPYIPYYEARKQTHGYFNVLSQGQAMVMSAMHAAMETSGRYHGPNGLLYSPARSRSAYTIEHH